MNNPNDFSFAFVELLVLLRGINQRPCLLLLNKIDLINVDAPNKNYVAWAEQLQIDRLQLEHPNLVVTAISAFNKLHIYSLKEWIKTSVRLFGELRNFEGHRPTGKSDNYKSEVAPSKLDESKKLQDAPPAAVDFTSVRLTQQRIARPSS